MGKAPQALFSCLKEHSTRADKEQQSLSKPLSKTHFKLLKSLAESDLL